MAAFIQFTALKKEDTRIYLHISKSLNEHNKTGNRRPIKCCHVVFYIKPDISVKIKQK